MTEDCKIGLRIEDVSQRTKDASLKVEDDSATMLSNQFDLARLTNSSRDESFLDNDGFGLADDGGFDDGSLF